MSVRFLSVILQVDDWSFALFDCFSAVGAKVEFGHQCFSACWADAVNCWFFVDLFDFFS